VTSQGRFNHLAAEECESGQGVRSGIVRIRPACRCDITSSLTLTTYLGECSVPISPGPCLYAATGRSTRCLGIPLRTTRDSTADACRCTCALGLQPRDIALADRVRYHVNVFWEKAPDRRTSRTLDLLNDACEARLDTKARHQGKVTYVALMSPTWVAFNFSAFDWKRPFTRVNRAKAPISLLVTTKPDTTGVSKTAPTIQSYVLFGMKKGRGRRAVVREFKWADIDSVKPEKDHFWCTIRTSAGTIWVGFATKFEVNVLAECLNQK